MPGGPNFFAELKRRNVLRATVLYAGAVWALSQGISQLTPALGLPELATRWFLIAALIGFPFWLAFAWLYEFTPSGFRRDADLPSDAPLRHSNARRLNVAIIGVMAIAIVLLATGYFVRGGAPAATRGAHPFDPPADTLAVLPFANASGDAGQRYFSDGITEELTNALSQNTSLRVIAWDTASRYRDRQRSAMAMGRALNVAHVLTGTIQRQAGDVRVVVELVNVRTGYQAWSDHYDDSLANVFQVQDKITAAIADALKVKLAALGAARTIDPVAHDLVLQARALMNKARTAAPYEHARTLLEQAIARAPAYADAHAMLARAWFDLPQYSTLPLAEALPRVREEANKALALDPRNVDALVELANADEAEGDVGAARAAFERALAIDPSNATAHLDYGNVLPLREGVPHELEAVRLDPDNAIAQNNLATTLLDLGEYQDALESTLATVRLDPRSADGAFQLALTYALLHRNEDAVRAFDLVRPDTPAGEALVAAGRLTYRAVLDPRLRGKARAAVDALRQRSDLDPFSMGDLTQLYLALGDNATTLELLPRYCATSPVACSDLSVYPVWLPLRDDPRFRALVDQYDTVSKPAASASAAPSTPTLTPS